MNVTATLFGQMITFIVFVWFIKAYLWEPLTQAMESRTKKISDGLAAAEQGHGARRRHARCDARTPLDGPADGHIAQVALNGQALCGLHLAPQERVRCAACQRLRQAKTSSSRGTSSSSSASRACQS